MDYITPCTLIREESVKSSYIYPRKEFKAYFCIKLIHATAMIKRKHGFIGERALVLPQAIIQEMEQTSLSAMLYITDIGYYPKAQHHYRERIEPITQYVFIYCIEGKGWVEINGEHHLIEKNQCFTLPANIPHRYGADEADPWTIYWIHFKGKMAQHYASRLYTPIEIKPSVHSRIKFRLDLFEEIYHTFEMGYSKENILFACSAFHYFLGSLSYLQQYRNATSDCETEDVIDAAIHYMKENINQKLSITELANQMGYSVSHFSAIFNKRTGYSALNYFNRLKIQHACHLLDFSDMKINQICYKIGIDDCYYFSRLFSKIMGMSPKAYKQQKKG